MAEQTVRAQGREIGFDVLGCGGHLGVNFTVIFMML
jgi:hypothetical protein